MKKTIISGVLTGALLGISLAIAAEPPDAEKKTINISTVELTQIGQALGAANREAGYWQEQYMMLRKCIIDAQKEVESVSPCVGGTEI